MRFLDQKQKGGRPAFKPTAADRHLARMAAAGGLSEPEIAAVVGVSRETLRKYFSDELHEARARALVENLARLDKAAQRGSVSAAKFLVSVFCGAATPLGGKKAAAQEAAKRVLSSGKWADLLALPSEETFQ